MAEGIPLNDEDRIPWLCALHDILRREDSSGQDAILACSALKKMYRRVLVSGASAVESNQPEQPGESTALKILFVHLDGPINIIAGRLEKRRGHFMPPELLKSQFDTLEPPSAPENFITVSVEKSLPEIVLEIESAIFPGEALLD
ncbi:putative gluconokinase isoform 2-T2 [Pluvialis apricaria]